MKIAFIVRLYNKEVSVGIIHNVRKQYKSHRRVFNFDKHELIFKIEVQLSKLKMKVNHVKLYKILLKNIKN